MPTKFTMRECSTCQRTTEHLENPPSHILHFLLTLTVGVITFLATGTIILTALAAVVWASFVWCLAIAFQPAPQCRTCGQKKK